MSADLEHIAKELKATIEAGTANTINLYDFASKYAIDLDLVNQALILDLNYTASLAAGTKDKVKKDMLELVDKIAEDFEEQELVSRNAKIVELEKRLHESYTAKKVDPEVVIHLKGVQKNYHSSNFKLGPINADFKLGEITGIVGYNANGKTTLFKIITGLINKDQGEIFFPFFDKSTKRKVSWQEVKHLTAYVPQEITQKWHGSLKDNLHYEAAIHGIKGKENDMAVNFIIQRLGLDDHINKKWQELSGGFKLRFALARALVWKPSLLVIDEPLANLDVSAQILILNDLKDLAHSYKNPFCVLISSQHLHEIECIADNLIVLDKGEIKYNGNLADYGIDRKLNIFEFSTDVGILELKKQMAAFSYKRLEHNGIHYIMYVDRSIDRKEFLDYCSKHQVEISYFRDISTSIKKFFLEDHIDSLNHQLRVN